MPRMQGRPPHWWGLKVIRSISGVKIADGRGEVKELEGRAEEA
jgi:hypothetical protein